MLTCVDLVCIGLQTCRDGSAAQPDAVHDPHTGAQRYPYPDAYFYPDGDPNLDHHANLYANSHPDRFAIGTSGHSFAGQADDDQPFQRRICFSPGGLGGGHGV